MKLLVVGSVAYDSVETAHGIRRPQRMEQSSGYGALSGAIRQADRESPLSAQPAWLSRLAYMQTTCVGAPVPSLKPRSVSEYSDSLLAPSG